MIDESVTHDSIYGCVICLISNKSPLNGIQPKLGGHLREGGLHDLPATHPTGGGEGTKHDETQHNNKTV